MPESATASVMTNPAGARRKDLRLNILVVDDSSSVRQYMKAKLEALSCDFQVDVDLADCGEAAVRCVEEKIYDIVFLDVVMPGMGGHEACKRIKQIRKTRVAMLSSLKSQADHQAGHVAGCDNYLTKPPQDSDLQAVLRIVSLRKAIAL